MATVTISKIQYQELKRKAAGHERIISAAGQELFTPPPTRDIKKVLAAFRGTKRYSSHFLKSMEKGLRRSQHFS